MQAPAHRIRPQTESMPNSGQANKNKFREKHDESCPCDVSITTEYDVRTLIAGITPENLHEATDWGAPAGRELT